MTTTCDICGIELDGAPGGCVTCPDCAASQTNAPNVRVLPLARKTVGYVIHIRGGLCSGGELCSEERAYQVAAIWQGLTGPIVAQRITEDASGERIYEDMAYDEEAQS